MKQIMRSTPDRIRHALSFEVLGILLITPIGALVFHQPITEFGTVGVVSAAVAMLWNYVYNLGFDHALVRVTGQLEKSLAIRIWHAVLFEFGLMLMLMPFIALYLGVGLVEALVMDASIAGFYVVYAFVFNWGYDRLFPLATGLNQPGRS